MGNIKAHSHMLQHTTECSRGRSLSKVHCFVKARLRELCRKDSKSLHDLFLNCLFSYSSVIFNRPLIKPQVLVLFFALCEFAYWVRFSIQRHRILFLIIVEVYVFLDFNLKTLFLPRKTDDVIVMSLQIIKIKKHINIFNVNYLKGISSFKFSSIILFILILSSKLIWVAFSSQISVLRPHCSCFFFGDFSKFNNFLEFTFPG